MDEKDGIRVEQGHKRVRVMFGGEVIADSIRPWLVWEVPYYPRYYFEPSDVRTELLVETGNTKRSPSRGEAVLATVRAGGREAVDAAYRYADSPVSKLEGKLTFDWRAMDHWFEEDEEVYVHPRDPYKRVDVLHSSRHVRVSLDGETLADSHQPTLLFETSLPVRYYLPKTDVRMELLTPTDTVTECPYKGTSSYWSVTVGDQTHPDLIWSYPFPTLESAKIAGLMGFYDEKVDIDLDGVRQERPKSPFS